MNNNFSNKENNNFDNKNFSYINNLYQNNNNCSLSNNLLKNNNYYSCVNNNINNFLNNSRKYNIGNDNSFFSNKNNNILINIFNPNINKFNNYNIYNHNDPSLNNRGNYNNYMTPINVNIVPYFNNNDYTHLLSHNYYNHINIENGINNISLNRSTNNNNMINLSKDNIQNLPIYNTNNNEYNNNNSKLIKSNNTTEKNKKENINNELYLNEFLQYINSLPMPLVNFLCTSKGIIEIQKKFKFNYEFKMFLTLHLNKDDLSKIMKNIYGNYFFQQLIKNSEEQFISLIISFISENFINISKDSSGTFSIQALLDEISTLEEEQKILNCIKNHEMEMAYDKNATHVLKKLILLFPDIHRIELNKIILDNLKDLCLHSNGICLIKNFIKTNTIISDKKRINNEIINNFVTIAESPFGNYGIQYLMENWDKDMLIDIRGKIMENLYKLSLQQFSSNVVEKAIEISEEAYKENIIKKLCFEDNFIELLKSKFGRFVLYKAINYMKIDLKNELENKLINNLNNNMYNNKDKNKIKKFLLKIQYKNSANDYSLFNYKYLNQSKSNINYYKGDKSNNEF